MDAGRDRTPPVHDGTRRVPIIGRVRHGDREHAALGVDIERAEPTVTLADDRVVIASELIASGDAECVAGSACGGSVAYDRPGATLVPGRLAGGTPVTVVARWRAAVDDVRALARWSSGTGVAYGVFADDELLPLSDAAW